MPLDDATNRDELVLGRAPRAAMATVGLAALLVVLPLYAVSAAWDGEDYGIDAFTNAVTAWYLANTGSPVVSGHEPIVERGVRGYVAWFVPSENGPVSQYPPGTAATLVPFYWLSGVETTPQTRTETRHPELGAVTVPVPPMWPATIAALLVTASFCGAVAATMLQLGTGRRDAIVVGVLAGTATSAWSVAANMSWTHGPAMLAVAAGGLAAARDRWFGTGLAYGAGILVRPHIAVVAAVLGLVVGFRRRDWRPVVAVGLGAGIGLAALLTYNAAVHGAPSVSGGYPPVLLERALAVDAWSFVRNVARGLAHPRYGLLIWAPFLLPLGLAAWRDRRAVPDWTVAAALGGIAYLLLQWKANRASGGAGYFSYRYPLEALAAAAPLLGLVGIRLLRGPEALLRRMLIAGLAIAVVMQAIGAFAT